MGLTFTDWFAPDTIIGNTINGWIYFNPVLVVAIYLTIVTLFLILIYRWRNKKSLKHAIRMGVVVSFCSVAIIYGLFSEIIWFRWLVTDIKTFHHLKGEAKLFGVEREIYRFIIECKNQLAGRDYSLLSNPGKEDIIERYFRDKMEYYLLPSRKKTNAEYIVVLFDNRVWFDQNTGHLYGNSKMPKVKLLYMYNSAAYLLKVSK